MIIFLKRMSTALDSRAEYLTKRSYADFRITGVDDFQARAPTLEWNKAFRSNIIIICMFYVMSTDDHTVRLQSDGSALPEPRQVTLAVFMLKAFDVPDIRNFHLNQVGQWVTHDTTFMLPESSGEHTVKSLHENIFDCIINIIFIYWFIFFSNRAKAASFL